MISLFFQKRKDRYFFSLVKFCRHVEPLEIVYHADIIDLHCIYSFFGHSWLLFVMLSFDSHDSTIIPACSICMVGWNVRVCSIRCTLLPH